MSTIHPPIQPDESVGDLASKRPGASRVFHRHGLDFCCGGGASLHEACAAAGLSIDSIVAEIHDEGAKHTPFERWEERPLTDVIHHILGRFHEPHREELPRLLAMARKVEAVHGEKPDCPRGLADHLERMSEELELHMQKEEQVLFPLIRSAI